VPKGREVLFHSENGILGVGPKPEPGKEDPNLVNAGKEFVTLLPGGCYFSQVDSFSMTRGKHVDYAVLGGMQVSPNGDLANWKVLGAQLGSIGGAMDIATGAKNVFIAMTHTTSKGEPKIVNKLTYAVTALRCVTRIYTDLAVIDVTPDGLALREVAPGYSAADVQAVTEPKLLVPREPGVIAV
jgi:3-oxoacid CoA-transferase B subunit